MTPFIYRIVVHDRVIQEGFRAREVLETGELFPLADGGGRIRKVVKLAGELADFEIHVTPIEEDE
jgi:hypothetical protein